VYDSDGNPVLEPGKVDAYRFMTFYLDALRQAQQSDRKPPCWRILHRVTFVSRLLPAATAPTATPVEAAMKTLDIASYDELISRLDPYVLPVAISLPALTDATNKALAAHLPALVPHAQAIVTLLALYYGMVS